MHFLVKKTRSGLFVFFVFAFDLFGANVVGVDVGSVDAPVVLDGLVLQGLPDLAVVAGSLGLFLVALMLDAGAWGRDGGAGAGGGGGDTRGVEDSVGLVHLLVMLLDCVPGLGGVGWALLCLFLRHGDRVVAGWLSGWRGGRAGGVVGAVGSVEALVVCLCVSRDGGEEGWHFGGGGV